MQKPPSWRPPEPLPPLPRTDRVRLDWFREEDAPALQAVIAAHRTALGRWLPWARQHHHRVEETLDWIRSGHTARSRPDAGDFGVGVFAPDRQEVLGGTGFHRIEADTATAEVGYWIRPDRQAEGLGTEAAAVLVTAGFRDWGFRRIRIACDGRNAASQRVAEKLGFRQERVEKAVRWDDRAGWVDELAYAVLAEEWDAERQRGPAAERPPEAAKAFAASDPRIAPYLESLLDPEDDVLRATRRRAVKAGLPDIAVGAFDGRHLEVLTRAAGARRAVEIGTLGGYSGICLARGLGEDGRLHTFELDPHHAEVARAAFAAAGLSDRVHVHVGPALERLRDIERAGPFDLVFVDADKEAYPAYLDWAERHVRPGGLLLADNVFRKPRGRPAGDVVHAFNERLVTSGCWRTTFLPVEDGLAVAVRLP